MRLTAAEIAAVTGGVLTGNGDIGVTGVMTDSRSSGAGHDVLFVALRGPNHDGHRFIAQLYGRGVRLFLADTLPPDRGSMPGAAFVTVNDTLAALQKLASSNRSMFGGRVIAITGSAGKTIVKEWLAETLGAVHNVIRSPKSYNSQVGVALSLLNLDNRHDIAVIEAGISKPGEMARLSEMIKPDTVIITNIGDAHGENFSGRNEVAFEKLRLAEYASRVIFCDSEIAVGSILAEHYPEVERIAWSPEGTSDFLNISSVALPRGGQMLTCSSVNGSFTVRLPFSDRASAENASSVIACCLTEGVPESVIAASAELFQAVAMRMEVKKGINGCTLIEDYYNSDPGSLGMALDHLRTQARGKATLILSDFRQIGGDERGIYGGVAMAVRNAQIDRFIGIGEALRQNRDLFPEGSQFYGSTTEFTDTFRSFAFRDETILLKGARAFGFERISSLLVQQLHNTRLEINMNAVVHNLNEFRHLLSPGTGVMAMVKAFAYGAGSAEIASLLEYHHADYFAVAYADEGVALREAGITTPVMVMNPDEGVMELIIRHNLEPEIYSFESFDGFIRAAKRYGLLRYPVHIKFDTGMHRLGFSPDDAEALAAMLLSDDHARVVSVFSHLAASEDTALDHFTRVQAERLVSSADTMRKALGYDFKMHLLNSSGIGRFPEYQFNMVRIGIGLYGIGRYEGVSLRQTGRFVSAVSQVRRVPAGEPVSYGCRGEADHEREIAVIPVGYADGFRRELGHGKGRLFIRGRSVSTVGSVCMDMCMADVTGMGVLPGDEAEIFGSNISIDELAALCNTIPYEILTSVPARVKRVYISE